ncbi:FHA domain-containing protein [Mucilaginibacter robiniae]|uniref:FHA domain-containing protein n=1 Tax=Mucilaginibacter robiniae TaxID=2728022 RepID=A0A7L5DXW6_9SPHI|nr:FHA domain-containing protein [Mucilaginibacter robiniae]QJD94869.1 FHA domain-containing protein [Mucilaginibacter robiniae]
MFNFFKSGATDRPTDVKGIRYALLQFIKQELQKAEGGEGSYIKGLCLYLGGNAAEKHVYEAAVYADEPDAFKAEIQKIADDYALALPDNWTLDVNFEQDFPSEAVKAPNLDAAFFIKTNKHFIRQTATAYISVLSGETSQKEYTITSEGGKVNIGRDKKAQVNDGFFRTNHIAFPSDSTNPANKYVSRQHAHIEWDNDSARFMIFADEGGVPPRNKVKVRAEATEELVKLHSTEIGYPLAEGDQIVVGESAVLQFSYHSLAHE